MKEKILSVGIDIGTSTSQIIISRLTLENFASEFTVPRIEISNKEIIYRSDIIFTPLINNKEIAIEPLKEFIEEQYRKAKITPESIQTGGVIITGETARKENAEKVLNALAHLAGDFVVASAGPDLESIIAGKGAGTEKLSKEKGIRATNIDMGGGTSNLVTFNNGDLESTGCFDIGGRLIKLDPQTKIISYISPKTQELIDKEHFNLAVGQTASVSELQKVTNIFANIIENAVGIGEKNPYFDLFITNHTIDLLGNIPVVTFSGGVADCLKDELPEDVFRYGDIGLILGNSIKHSKIYQEKEVANSVETIQATVVGAGSHLTEVSGSTIEYVKDILPLQNIPVLHLEKVQESLNDESLVKQIGSKLQWYEDTEYDGPIALGFEGWRNPHFEEIQRLAKLLVDGLQSKLSTRQPIIIIAHHDIGKSLGQSLYSLLPEAYPFISIDSIQVDSGDYVDIGLPVAGGSVLPVIVKTLVFG